MDIVVLAGGISSERAVSLQSGRCVADALQEKGHRVTLCDPATLFFGESKEQRPDAPFVEKEALCAFLARLQRADTVFMALHGGAGEDGTWQSVLELLRIPYTGPDPLGCRLAMHKALAKQLLHAARVPVPFGVLIEDRTQVEWERICYPCVVKPNAGGSSIGVCWVQNETQCRQVLSDSSVPMLCETYIEGREFSVGVLEGEVLPIAEIFANGRYDYDSKYRPDGAREVCPAPLTQGEEAELKRLALCAARALHLESVCRVDFLQSAQNGQFYCLEANALPGMTARSLLPLCAKANGISYPDLCERLAQMGSRRFA